MGQYMTHRISEKQETEDIYIVLQFGDSPPALTPHINTPVSVTTDSDHSDQN